MRDITRLTRLIDEYCEINAKVGFIREVVAPRHVRAVAEKLDLRGNR